MFNRLLYSSLTADEIEERMQLWLIRTAPEQDFRQGLHIHGAYKNNRFNLNFYYHYEVETIRYDGPYRVTGNVVEQNQTTLVTYKVVPYISGVSFLGTLSLFAGLFFAIQLLTDGGIVISLIISTVITLILCAVFVYPNYVATCTTVEEIITPKKG